MNCSESTWYINGIPEMKLFEIQGCMRMIHHHHHLHLHLLDNPRLRFSGPRILSLFVSGGGWDNRCDHAAGWESLSSLGDLRWLSDKMMDIKKNQHVDSDFFFETYIEYYEKLITIIHTYIFTYECVYRIIHRYVHLIWFSVAEVQENTPSCLGRKAHGSQGDKRL